MAMLSVFILVALSYSQSLVPYEAQPITIENGDLAELEVYMNRFRKAVTNGIFFKNYRVSILLSTFPGVPPIPPFGLGSLLGTARHRGEPRRVLLLPRGRREQGVSQLPDRNRVPLQPRHHETPFRQVRDREVLLAAHRRRC